MSTTPHLTEARIERLRIEAVFLLTGGELATPDSRFPDPWDPTGPPNYSGFAYWYEGVPEYVEREFAHEWAENDTSGPEYRTAILCGVYGLPTPPNGWTEVAHYTTSGETECPYCNDDDADDHATPRCPICEDDGLIYIGEGYAEVVYRRNRPDPNAPHMDAESQRIRDRVECAFGLENSSRYSLNSPIGDWPDWRSTDPAWDDSFAAWQPGIPYYCRGEDHLDRIATVARTVYGETFCDVFPPDGWETVKTFCVLDRVSCNYCGPDTGEDPSPDPTCYLCNGTGYVDLTGWNAAILVPEGTTTNGDE